MDPNATLVKIRAVLSKFAEAERTGADLESWDALELAECIEALDGWLSRGGAPPNAWKRTGGGPPQP